MTDFCGRTTLPGPQWRWGPGGWVGCGPPGPGQTLTGWLCTVLPGRPSDPVELDAPAVLLHRGAPEGEHCLLPGGRWPSPRPFGWCPIGWHQPWQPGPDSLG